MTMTTTTNAVKKIQEAVPDESLRITRRIEIGHVLQQGDVYLHRVADDHPRGEEIGVGLVQVALGTGNGARHMAEGAVRVFAGEKLPAWCKAPMDVAAEEVTGPVVVAAEVWHLTHPEHPHHRIPPGVYQVTYQYDPRTMRRVVD
jgi:hypothetical protein